MVYIIGQLLAPLYLLLITYPRLSVGITILFILGAVMIWALVHKRASSNMAVPVLDRQSSTSDGRVKTSTTTTGAATPTTTAPSAATAATTIPTPASFSAVPTTPRLEALGPVSRTSSSSTTSSDLLLPVPVTGPSSWPGPIPWRSSWGFLRQHEHTQDERQVQQEQQGHNQSGQLQQHGQAQAQQDAVPARADITSTNTDFLMLPPGAETRRTGSMEARKGSACTYTLFGVDERVQGLALGNAGGARGNERDDAPEGGDDAGRSDLAGVGGQFC